MNKNQELARERNWAKARLLSITSQHPPKNSTEIEKLLYKEIHSAAKALLKDWEENDNKFRLTSKRYKCWCGKRTTVLREVIRYGVKETVCAEHELNQ